MKRIKLTVAYDGTNYSGWQAQNNAVTIEGVLNKVLSKILNREDLTLVRFVKCIQNRIGLYTLIFIIG